MESFVKKPRNYYVELYDQTIQKVVASGKKPPLLLHACCAPCSTAVLVLLTRYFEVTLYFNGHNIYPYAEYLKRLETLKTFVEIMKRDYQQEVNLVVIAPEIDDFMDKLSFGKDEKEGQRRCQACFALRLQECFEYAKKHHFPYVTTVMTISRQKCADKINGVAKQLMQHYDTFEFVYADFKKRKGIDLSRDLCKAYDLYQQNYCGCKFSIRKEIEKNEQ